MNNLEKMIYEVSSVTMAQRGKIVLERAGVRAYIDRQYEDTGRNGCGYILMAAGNPDRIARLLNQAGIRVHGVRPAH